MNKEIIKIKMYIYSIILSIRYFFGLENINLSIVKTNNDKIDFSKFSTESVDNFEKMFCNTKDTNINLESYRIN